MTQPAKANEPTMEEILASIRRIIADDDATKSAQPVPEAPKPAVQAAPAVRPVMPPPRMPAAAPPPPPRVTPPPVSPVEPPAPAAAESEEAEEESADILELTESMAAPVSDSAPLTVGAPAAAFRTIEGDSDVGFDEPQERAPPRASAEPPPPPPRLLSQATSAAVDSAFNSLAQTVLVQNAKTLEDLVREMLRPMLKAWLDENLPALVERLVRAEIERVSRGR
jgi:uncharacterized protein